MFKKVKLNLDRSNISPKVIVVGNCEHSLSPFQFGDRMSKNITEVKQNIVRQVTALKEHYLNVNSLCAEIAKVLIQFKNYELTEVNLDNIDQSFPSLLDKLLQIHPTMHFEPLSDLMLYDGGKVTSSDDPKFTFTVNQCVADDADFTFTESDREQLPELLSYIRENMVIDTSSCYEPLRNRDCSEVFAELSDHAEHNPVAQDILSLSAIEYLHMAYSIPDKYLNLENLYCKLEEVVSSSLKFGSVGSLEDANNPKKKEKVFIVHGRNEDSLKKVKKHVKDLGLVPIILHEQVSGGRSIFENFELNTNVGSAIVLYDADELVYLADSVKGKSCEVKDAVKRCRPNVLVEHGYLMAKLGSDRIIMLVSDNEVDIPTDLLGITYVPMQAGWRARVKEELLNMNIKIEQ
tara:strand:- start:113364 stop:114578 length:1215 start_codon:yes stop_codon:yes gene_type:complete